MLCPLCQNEVENEESLQLHYLSCSAYTAIESANQTDDSVLAKFRWIKAKPCFEEQVYLISSLAGSVPLKWSDDEGLYESELTSLPLGEHVCQLAVAGDVIPTEDVPITKDSDTIYIIIREDPQSQFSTRPGLFTDYLVPSGVSTESDGTKPLGLTSITTDDILGGVTDDHSEVLPRTDGGNVGEQSPLYQELLRHQEEHGEPSWVPSGGARDLDSPSDFTRQLDRNSPMSDVSDAEMPWSTRPEATGASNQRGQQSSEASNEDRPSPSLSLSSHNSSAAASPIPSPSGPSPVALVDTPPELDTRTQTPSRSVNVEDHEAVVPLAPGPSGVAAVSRETVDSESAASSPRRPRSVASDHDAVRLTERPSPSQTHSLPSSPGTVTPGGPGSTTSDHDAASGPTVSPRGPRSDASDHDVTKSSPPEPAHSRPRTPGSVEVANIDGARATSGVNEYPVIHSTRRPASSSAHSSRSMSPLHRRNLAESAQENGHRSSASASPVHSLILSEPDRRSGSPSGHDPDASRTSSVASPRSGAEAGDRDPRTRRSPASSVHSGSSGRRRTSQQGEENSRVVSPGSTDGVSQRSFGFRSPPAVPPSSVFTGSGQSSPTRSPVLSPHRHSEIDTSPREPLAAPPTVVSIPSRSSAFQPMDGEHRIYEARPGETEALRQERDELARRLDQTIAYYNAHLAQLRKKNEDLEQQLLSVQTAAGLDHEELEDVKRLQQKVLELKEALGEREAEVQRLEESNRRMEEEQESLKTVNKIQMDDLREVNTHLECKLKRLEKESHGRSSRELRELNQLHDQIGRLQKERSELTKQLRHATTEIGTLKTDKMLIESKLTRAKSATDLSFNRILTHDNSRFKESVSRYDHARSTHRMADVSRHGTEKHSGSYSSPYAMANGHYSPSYKDSSSGNVKWFDDEQQTGREMFSTTTSRRPFQYELDAYKKRHLTPPPTRRRFGSLDDDSDLSDVADIAYHTRHDEVPAHRRTNREVRTRSHRPHSYHGSSSFLDYSKHDTHHRSASHSPPDTYSTVSSPYTSDSSTIIATSHRTASLSHPSQSVLTKPFAPSSADDICLGMRVLVTRTRGKIGRGVVRYVGNLPGRTDTYLGVELDNNDGKHDGSFDGHRFFKCQAQKGIFVSFNKVVMCYG